MKKFLAIALSLVLALGSLAACGKTETPPAETTAPAVTAPEKELAFKEAYYDVLVDENGEMIEPYTETVDEEDGYRYYTGRLFAELFDWNLDGVPELMIGYSTEKNITYNVDYLDVYTVENGEAKKILTADVYASFKALDGSQAITFNHGNDGTLYLGVYNKETDEMRAYGETLYSFKDGVVEQTTLYFRNENAYEGPDSLVDFRIDGNDVTEEEFNAKAEELGTEDSLNVFAERYEYDELVSYLAGETDRYRAEYFIEAAGNDMVPSWVTDVDFGYNKTYKDSDNEEVDFEALGCLVEAVWITTPASHYPYDEDADYSEEDFIDNIVYYDSSSDDALAYAMFMIMNEGISFARYNNLVTDITACYDNGSDEEIPADPLGQFEILPGEGYWKINADQVDWVLINHLNVTPDREKTDDDFDIEHHGVFDYYYYDGYYYYDLVEGGGGGGYPPTLIDYVVNEDESYTVTYSSIDEIYPGDEYNIMEVNAFIREVDGEEIWCINYFKDIEYISGE